MDRIELGATGRTTTRLGFGCSSLMGAMGRRESSAMLEAAFDAGIRHFDVAPMYGFGQAEGCLGEFLGRHRGEVTVTTKYGIPPVRSQGWMGLARRAAGARRGGGLPGGVPGAASGGGDGDDEVRDSAGEEPGMDGTGARRGAACAESVAGGEGRGGTGGGGGRAVGRLGWAGG